MVILNAKKVPALLALFLALTVSVWAQQKRDASPGNRTVDPYEAKKSLYREAGIEWKYNDGASMEVAKQMVKTKSVQNPVMGSTSAPATISGLGVASPEKQLVKSSAPVVIHAGDAPIINPARVASLSKTNISNAEYASYPAEKKAYVQANASRFTIGGVAAKDVKAGNIQPKHVISASELKNMPVEKQNAIKSHPELYEVN